MVALPEDKLRERQQNPTGMRTIIRACGRFMLSPTTAAGVGPGATPVRRRPVVRPLLSLLFLTVVSNSSEILELG